MKMKSFFWLAAGFMVLAGSDAAQAEENTAILTVTVTITSAPCEINNNQVIDVDFGNSVLTTEVAKGTYEKAINYTLDCSNADSSKILKMRIEGTGATFDSTVLQTSVPALGIKLKANGNVFPLGSDLAFSSMASKPALTALLVQQSGSRLPTGDFSAGATMTVSYQ